MKILYVTTVSDTMGFFTSHIKMLLEEGHTVDMACNIGNPLPQELLDLGCNAHNLEFQRSPLSSLNLLAYKRLKRLIIENNYEIVHTHTPIASACVRLACRKMRKVKIIYTAHGFHFYKGAPLKNWLIYYPIEKWLSIYTDVLITINKEDFNRATRSFKAGNVKYIPGVGLETINFNRENIDKTSKRHELGLPIEGFVILSVGELNKNKNHETIIKALAKLNNSNVYYVICGKGPLENYLRDLIKILGLERQVKLLGYRKDISEICQAVDVFAFPSYREGLGLAALEAMAAGLPLVTSNVHGIIDYSVDNLTGFTCSPGDVESFTRAFLKLINDGDLMEKISKHNILNVQKFDIKNVLPMIKKIY